MTKNEVITEKAYFGRMLCRYYIFKYVVRLPKRQFEKENLCWRHSYSYVRSLDNLTRLNNDCYSYFRA